MKKISVIALLVMIVAILLNSCGRGAPPPKEDFTPPTVVEAAPGDGSSNVSVQTKISVHFSEPMDESSVNTSTFLLNDPNSGPVPGVVTCSGAAATFTPLAPLGFSTTYVVAITTGARDKAGNNMFAINNFVFTTGEYVDTIPPQVLATAPTGTEVGVNSVVVVTFNEPMDPWSFTPQSIIVSDVTHSIAISGGLTISSLMAIFQPDMLEKLTTYRVVVAGSVEDLSGNPMGQPFTWEFATPEWDNDRPSVIGTYPTGSATNVPVTATISIAFSELMLVSSITPSAVVLTEKNASGDIEIAGNIFASGATSLLTPMAPLKYNTNYIVTLVPGWGGPTTGITDLANNPLKGNGSSADTYYSWTFRTEVSPSFVITASAGTGGTISPSGSVGVPYQGSRTFTITPSTGNHIVDVLVDGVSVGNVGSYSFTNVQANHSISATFAINNYILSITKTGTGNGDVQTQPWKDLVWLNSTTTPTFDHGTTVILTAYEGTPTAPSTFSGWTGCNSVSGNQCTVAMTSAKSVTATFTLNNYTLSVSKAGLGSGNVTPNTGTLIWTGSTGTAAYPYNTTVILTAAASPGSTFSGWSGEGCTGTGTCTVTVNQYRSVTATFTLNNFTITATAGTGGTISPASRLVSYGSTTTFTVTPNTGYTAAVGGTCGGTLAGTTYTTNLITAACTVSATFTLNGVTVTATAGTGGTISPASRVVSYGSTTTFTVQPNTGYSIGIVSGCTGTLSGNTYTTGAITAPCTVGATFTLNAYTVTATAGANGTISPASSLVSHGSTTTFTVTPSAGYTAVVGGTCGGTLAGTAYTTSPIIVPCTVSATFTLNAFMVTATAGANGTISPATRSVGYGGTTTFTITPSAGYTAVVGGTCGGTLIGTTYETNPITGNCTVDATFTLNAYTVTATAGANGTISPASSLVSHGSATTFTVTPSANYIAVVGGTCGGTLVGTTYTTNAIIAPCTVSATFTLNAYTVTATAGANGTISPASVNVNHGSTTAFTVTPSVGYTAVVGGTCGGTLVGTIYTTNAIIAPCTVSATFTLNAYSVTATAGANGTISPASRLVSHGSTTTFTVTPSAGYTAVVGGTCGGTLVGTTYTTNAIIAPCTVDATFTLNAYTVTATAGANGSISPSGAVAVAHGTNQAFTITPALGYHVADVLVDGASVGAVTSYTFTNVTAPHTISASFAIDTFTITPSAGANGSISPSTIQTVNYGANATFSFTPITGYHVSAITVDGAPVGLANPYTLTNVTANHLIAVAFEINTYTITPAAGPGGTITPSTVVLVNHGSSRQFTIAPDMGYHIIDVLADGVSVGAVTSYTFTNVTADHTISATFAINTYTVTPSVVGGNGSISPSTVQTVNYGATPSFTITPVSGYHVLNVLVDGASVGAVTSYQFTSVQANHTISATFAINTYTVTATAAANGTLDGTTPSPATVNHGSPASFKFNANANYHVASVTDTCGGTAYNNTSNAVTTYTYATPGITAAGCSVTANFAINTYTVTATAAANGTLDGTTPSPATVNHGSPASFKFNANANYHVASVTDTCGGTAYNNTSNAVTTYTYATPGITAAGCSVTANFAINTYTVTATAAANGTLDGTTPSPATVNHGSPASFKFNANANYHVASVTDTCGGTAYNNTSNTVTTYTYTTPGITAGCSVTANFAINTYTVTATATANGTLDGTTPSPATVNHGSPASFKFNANATYHVASVTDTCGGTAYNNTSNTVTTYTYTTPGITAAGCSVTASFAINSYTVSTSAGAGGSFSPTSASVNHGSTTAFTVNANPLFYITSISGCGGTDYTNTDPTVTTYDYATGAIAGDCTVAATYDVAPLAPIGATQGIGFGSLGAMSFLLNHKLFGNLFRRRRKQKGSRSSPGNEG